MYIQNSVNYTLLPFISNAFDSLTIRTSGATNILISVVYKPPNTTLNVFTAEILVKTLHSDQII